MSLFRLISGFSKRFRLGNTAYEIPGVRLTAYAHIYTRSLEVDPYSHRAPRTILCTRGEQTVRERIKSRAEDIFFFFYFMSPS